MSIAASLPIATLHPSPSTLWAHIYGPGTGYIGLFSGRRHPGVKELLEVESAYYTWPEQAEPAEAWLREHAERGREVYACGHLLTGHQRVKLNAAKMWALYSDDDGAHVPEHLPRPTAVVQSSPGRTQSYWRLTEAIEPRRAEQLNRRIASAMGADPSGWDLTQLLRVVGMPNRKYDDAPIVELVDVRDDAYDPDELDRLLPPLPVEAEREQAHVRTERRADATPSDADRRLLETMSRGKRGEQRRRLYEGDASDFRKPDGSIDWSGADQSIANAYAYYTDKDPERMDRLHRISGLFAARPNPEKWDEVHYADGRTYGEGTIGTAIGGCRETYRDHTGRPADAEPARAGADNTADSAADAEDPAALKLEVARLCGVIDNLADVVHVQQVALRETRAELEEKVGFLSNMSDVLAKPNEELSAGEKVVSLALLIEVHFRADYGTYTLPDGTEGSYRTESGKIRMPREVIARRSGYSPTQASKLGRQVAERENAPFGWHTTRDWKARADGTEGWITTIELEPHTERTADSLRAMVTLPALPDRPKHGGSAAAVAARWGHCDRHDNRQVLLKGHCPDCGKVVGERMVSRAEFAALEMQDAFPEAPPPRGCSSTYSDARCISRRAR